MQLITSPNLILKQKASDWDFTVDKALEGAEIVERQMTEMMNSYKGRGLAANQVGLLYRVFVIHIESEDKTIAMFNPKVLAASEDLWEGEEGCLSFPDLWLTVKRPKTIEAEYLDKQGNKCIITLSGIDAKCFLHELDHLDGVCFTDKVSTLKLAMAIKKQKKRKRNG